MENKLIQNGNNERQLRYPAEDIRLKNKSQTQNVVPIPVVQQVPLVSNAYQDDDDDDDDNDDDEQSDNTTDNQGRWWEIVL